jgi:hypothetical protein
MIPTIKDATDMVDVFLYRELVKARLVETPEESEVPGHAPEPAWGDDLTTSFLDWGAVFCAHLHLFSI